MRASPSAVRGQGKVARKKFVTLENPFNSMQDPLVLLPALNPNVVLIHVQQAGEERIER